MKLRLENVWMSALRHGPHYILWLVLRTAGCKSGISLLDFFFSLHVSVFDKCTSEGSIDTSLADTLKTHSSNILLVKINNVRYRQKDVGIITGDCCSLRGRISSNGRRKNLDTLNHFWVAKHTKKRKKEVISGLFKYTGSTLETPHACDKDWD